MATRSTPHRSTSFVSLAETSFEERADCGHRRSSHRGPVVYSPSITPVRLLVVAFLTLTAVASQSTVQALPRLFDGGMATRVRIQKPNAGNGYRRRDLNIGGVAKVANGDVHQSTFRRTNQCVATNGRCLTTSNCCRGLVCADLNEQHPNELGHCIRQKELQPCTDYLDCSSNCRCTQLTPGHFYCLPSSRPADPYALSISPLVSSRTMPHNPEVMTASGIGSPCQTSAECSPSSKDGARQLCCVLVRRGFQQPRRMCDRITPVSTCIAPPSQ